MGKKASKIIVKKMLFTTIVDTVERYTAINILQKYLADGKAHTPLDKSYHM
jgi:hypothetical protein